MKLELAEARRRIEEKYTQRVCEAESERAADLAALDRLMRLVGADVVVETQLIAAAAETGKSLDGEEANEPRGDSNQDTTHIRQRGELLAKVWKAVDAIGNEEFSFREIQNWLADTHPELGETTSNSITQVLRRCKQLGQIVEVKVGVGRRPTTYRRA